MSKEFHEPVHQELSRGYLVTGAAVEQRVAHLMQDWDEDKIKSMFAEAMCQQRFEDSWKDTIIEAMPQAGSITSSHFVVDAKGRRCMLRGSAPRKCFGDAASGLPSSTLKQRRKPRRSVLLQA